MLAVHFSVFGRKHENVFFTEPPCILQRNVPKKRFPLGLSLSGTLSASVSVFSFSFLPLVVILFVNCARPIVQWIFPREGMGEGARKSPGFSGIG